jgi:signal transduction histidine kinase
MATMVRADKNLIKRVFSNLLSNAVKFTQEGGIDIYYSLIGGKHQVTVQDSGPGVDPGEVTQIFDRYHQSGKKESGWGLGLNIARQIVQAHGGDIEVAPSERGARFIFTLPKEDK